jgi:predicted dehydrogenase
MIEGKDFAGSKRVLRYGMVGGGPGSFIGGVHRAAINLEGAAQLVAGCFSSDKERNEAAGRELRLDESRVYTSFQEMAEKEAQREDKIDFAVITTPNHVHYAASKAFLEKGISVVCEKPLTTSLADALELKKIAADNGCLFGVAYVYASHVMAKEARELVRSGEIGEIVAVMGEYPQEWLIDVIEKDANQRQAAWRTDPEKAGKSNCVGDIGTHIENMVSYITGLRIKKLCATLDIVGEGRKLDTNANILIKYDNGATGNYWCSQVAIGYDNALRVRIFGTKGAIEFEQEKSNYLKVTKKGQPTQIYSRGNGYISPAAAAYSRIPSGHPEGYHDAFANLYRSFTNALIKKLDGEPVNEKEFGYPTIDEGIDGVRFIEKCIESSNKGGVWVDVE